MNAEPSPICTAAAAAAVPSLSAAAPWNDMSSAAGARVMMRGATLRICATGVHYGAFRTSPREMSDLTSNSFASLRHSRQPQTHFDLGWQQEWQNPEPI